MTLTIKELRRLLKIIDMNKNENITVDVQMYKKKSKEGIMVNIASELRI